MSAFFLTAAPFWGWCLSVLPRVHSAVLPSVEAGVSRFVQIPALVPHGVSGMFKPVAVGSLFCGQHSQNFLCTTNSGKLCLKNIMLCFSRNISQCLMVPAMEVTLSIIYLLFRICICILELHYLP